MLKKVMMTILCWLLCWILHSICISSCESKVAAPAPVYKFANANILSRSTHKTTQNITSQKVTTSSWRLLGPLDFVLHTFQALKRRNPITQTPKKFSCCYFSQSGSIILFIKSLSPFTIHNRWELETLAYSGFHWTKWLFYKTPLWNKKLFYKTNKTCTTNSVVFSKHWLSSSFQAVLSIRCKWNKVWKGSEKNFIFHRTLRRAQ